MDGCGALAVSGVGSGDVVKTSDTELAHGQVLKWAGRLQQSRVF